MNDIRIFDNPEFGEVRTLMIDGEPWFVAKDISEVLEYSKTFSMMKRIDEEDKKNISSSDLEERVGNQPYTIGVINESGLYVAIFGSKLPSAKKFKRWVTSEVLPQLRKTGRYGLSLTTEQQIQLLAQGNVELNQKVDNLSGRMDAVEKELPLLPVDADRISNAVKAKGAETLGGKESKAYHNKSLCQNVYASIYGNLKYNFGITGTYKKLKRSQTDKALEIVRNYQPPLYLKDRIENENSGGQEHIREDKPKPRSPYDYM